MRGLFDLGVFEEDGAERVARGGVEVKAIAELLDAVHQGSVAFDLVGMGVLGVRAGHVVVPVVAQAAVARVGLLGAIVRGDGPGDGLQVEVRLLVVQRGGVVAEVLLQFADAAVKVVPCLEGVVEAGAVCVAVIGDGVALLEELVCAAVPCLVGGEVLELGSVGYGEVVQIAQLGAVGFEFGKIVFDVGEGEGAVLVACFGEDGIELRKLVGGECVDRGLLSEFAKALDEIGVADDVERVSLGGGGAGNVVLPVAVEAGEGSHDRGRGDGVGEGLEDLLQDVLALALQKVVEVGGVRGDPVKLERGVGVCGPQGLPGVGAGVVVALDEEEVSGLA